MPLRGWKAHWGRVALGAVVVVGAGLAFGHWFLVTTLGLAVYLGWLLYNTGRLYRWLTRGEGEPPESFGIWSEIFDRISALQRRNREQLEQNQAIIREFQSMTDAFPDSIMVLDEDDCITWFNDAAREMLGLRDPEDVSQPVTNLLRDPDFANWMAVEEQVESRFEMASPRDPNVRLNVSAVSYREGQRLLILRDITDIHNLEQVRRDFVANVSHELRTPLTVLVGYLESMRDACPEELADAVERMESQARQMQMLLNDLLELSRLQTESRQDHAGDEEVDICAILMQLREQAEEISQGNHEISVLCESGHHLRGASKDLESAFRNLIANAIHYTPEGGSIEIRWGLGQSDADEGELVFSVSDTGIGIPRRDIPRLTERFYRVGSDRSRHTGGTGLGLAIVKHVLNAHGARLAIESEFGEGSTFSCIFPRERVMEADEEQAAQKEATKPSGPSAEQEPASGDEAPAGGSAQAAG